LIWNLTTWYFGLPVSSSHCLTGSLFGAGQSAFMRCAQIGSSACASFSHGGNDGQKTMGDHHAYPGNRVSDRGMFHKPCTLLGDNGRSRGDGIGTTIGGNALFVRLEKDLT